MLVFQNFKGSTHFPSDGQFVPFQMEKTTSKYPITLFVYESDDSFYFNFSYLTSYFSRADVDVLIADFKSLITFISLNYNSSITDIIGHVLPEEPVMENDITFNF
jgi:mycobactin peptide synthetase MbtE